MTSPPNPLSASGEGERKTISISPSPPEERGPGGEVHWHTPPHLWEQLKPFAREMRHDPTRAEAALWQALRGRRLAGLRFRRQHAIDQFIVDFYCSDKRLVVEADGSAHENQRGYDEARDHTLSALGFSVLRFTNDQILLSLDHVLETIAAQAAILPLSVDGEGAGGVRY